MWTITKFVEYVDQYKKPQLRKLESRGRFTQRSTALQLCGKLNVTEPRLDITYQIEECSRQSVNEEVDDVSSGND